MSRRRRSEASLILASFLPDLIESLFLQAIPETPSGNTP